MVVLLQMLCFASCQVLKWVEETVQAMKVHLLSSNHDSAQENNWEVPFDPSLREVTVSLSGPAPEIELSDPLGRKLIPAFPIYSYLLLALSVLLKKVMFFFEITSVMFPFPRSGSWCRAGP